MTGPGLIFEQRGRVAWLTLNRPKSGNALDVPLARALMEAAIRCDQDEQVRCVVLTGTPPMFCAGGDIDAFVAAGDQAPSLIKELTAYVHMAVTRLAHMPKPLVTAVNGSAAGVGLSLAVLGDIVLASRSAHFTLAYSRIGLSPDGGATWLLPRLIGLRRAQELALTNQKVPAEEAVTLGLATRSVEAHELLTEAGAVAERLVHSAVKAVGRTRGLLLKNFSNSLEEQMELEAQEIAEAVGTAEGREGIDSFKGKRRPDFLSLTPIRD